MNLIDLVSVKEIYKTGIRGTIESPNFPENYGFMKDYYWRVATYGGRVIELTVDFLDIESAGDCAKDFLKVFDGLNARATLLKTYCGDTSKVATTITSSRNYMYLHFRADGDNDGRGFKVIWKALTPVKATLGTTIKQKTVTTASGGLTKRKLEGMKNANDSLVDICTWKKCEALYFLYFEKLLVVCTCNAGTLETEFWCRLIPVGGNSRLIGGWIV